MQKIVIEISSYIVGFALFILISDALAFALWVASGQTPVDSFYFGTITAHLIGLFI